MNKLPSRSGFHLQMTHNYFICRWVSGLFIYSRWIFFSVHWARSEKVKSAQGIGRKDTGLQKNRVDKLSWDAKRWMLSIECNEYFTPAFSIRAFQQYLSMKGGKKEKHKHLKNTFFFSRHGGSCGQKFRECLWQAVCHLRCDWVIAPSSVLSRSKQCHPSIVITPLPSSPWNDLSLINCILMSRST